MKALVLSWATMPWKPRAGRSNAGAVDAESPIGRYAGTLALLVLGDDVGARVLGTTLRDRDDFPPDVAWTRSSSSRAATGVDYAIALENILDSFRAARADFLEDVPVADTVLVLQALDRAARYRGRARAVADAAVAGVQSSAASRRQPRTAATRLQCTWLQLFLNHAAGSSLDGE